jgi:hypothetical protein
MLDDDGVWVIYEIRDHTHVNIAAYRMQEEAVRHKAADQYIAYVSWGDCEGHQNIEGIECSVAKLEDINSATLRLEDIKYRVAEFRNSLIHNYECLKEARRICDDAVNVGIRLLSRESKDL